MERPTPKQWLKRIFLWTGLFGAGVLLGLAYGWFGVQWLQRYKASHGMTVTLSATIDGTDRFCFTPEQASNKHTTWGIPKNVLFNGVPWLDLSQPPPGWREVGNKLDLSKAAIVTRKGRDVILLEHTTNGFDVYFVDTPFGAGSYEVTVSIPMK